MSGVESKSGTSVQTIEAVVRTLGRVVGALVAANEGHEVGERHMLVILPPLDHIARVYEKAPRDMRTLYRATFARYRTSLPRGGMFERFVHREESPTGDEYAELVRRTLDLHTRRIQAEGGVELPVVSGAACGMWETFARELNERLPPRARIVRVPLYEVEAVTPLTVRRIARRLRNLAKRVSKDRMSATAGQRGLDRYMETLQRVRDALEQADEAAREVRAAIAARMLEDG